MVLIAVIQEGAVFADWTGDKDLGQHVRAPPTLKRGWSLCVGERYSVTIVTFWQIRASPLWMDFVNSLAAFSWSSLGVGWLVLLCAVVIVVSGIVAGWLSRW